MRVVVGLSGGVDSAVSAYLLKQQGHEVIGLFMRNWNDASSTLEDECPWIQDSNDAMMVAKQLDIPFQVIDMSNFYKKRIVDYMFSEYKNGKTPNPDILCNKEIKFDTFLNTALSLGAKKVATGHYARVFTFNDNEGNTIHRLLAGIDNNKDQSYFLCQLNQYQLSKSLFPLGELTKTEVREIAKKARLCVAQKKDSQGLCFVGKISLPEFLCNELKPEEGDIVEIPAESEKYNEDVPKFKNKEEELFFLSSHVGYKKEDGKTIGKHKGARYFTIGQRKGLSIGGHTESCFVIERDIKKNILYVGEGKNHPGLYKKVLRINKSEVHWIREDLKLQDGQSSTRLKIRFRHRQPLQDATLHQFEKFFFIEFERPQLAIAKGQFAAWYSQEEELQGSGIIAC